MAEPGVFCLPEGSRVFQAIDAAGGFLPEAAENYVNRAQGLSDGEQIYVPTKEEAFTMERTDTVSSGEKNGEALESGTEHAGKVNLNTADETELCTLTGIGASKAKAIIAYREENGPFASLESGTEHAGKVNLNTADETELCTLTGIGASKAKAIIAYREENGPFASVEDLMKVEGIKEGTFHKIKDEIEVG